MPLRDATSCAHGASVSKDDSVCAKCVAARKLGMEENPLKENEKKKRECRVYSGAWETRFGAAQ